jgi:hypothetical protein
LAGKHHLIVGAGLKAVEQARLGARLFDHRLPAGETAAG